MKVGAMRVLAVVGMVGVLAAGFAGKAGAAGDWAEGYCTPEGKPVVTYWPPGWEGKWEVTCQKGRIIFSGVSVSEPTILDTAPKEQPPDFGRWVHILFNGAWLVNPYNDVTPFVVKSTGRTLIPLRYVSEAFGATVNWEQSTRTAQILWQGRQVNVTVDQDRAYVDGHELVLDQAPILWQDRTLVPLRFVVEAFGAKIEWHDAASEVVINLPGVECAPSYCRR